VSSIPQGCCTEIDSLQTQESSVSSRAEFLVLWLNQQRTKLARLPLQRLLHALDIDFDATDDVRHLRRYLKRYTTDLKSKISAQHATEQHEVERASIQTKLEKIRAEWPTLVQQSLKDKIITLFREQTSSKALKTVTCASCAESCLLSQSHQVNVRDVNLDILKRPDHRLQRNSSSDIVDPTWLSIDVIPPTLPCPIKSMPDVLLDPAGVHIDEDSHHILLNLCRSCKSSITSGKVPPMSLANHTVLGNVPEQLEDLTVVEEAMIARCRAKCWIVQLKEEKTRIGTSPSAQRGVKGHVIIYPQRPSSISSLLPPSIDEIVTPICVIFVGSSPPSDEWLRKNATPLVVRREKVRNALTWLKSHNPLYNDIGINHHLLDSLPDDYTLPVHVEHVLPDPAHDALTSRYDNLNITQPPYDDTNKAIPFQNVVITDVDGSAPSNELRAAAMRHIKKKGGGYIEIPHDPEPVNEFFHPDMFPMIYPTLFPYGIGGFEDKKRSSRLSLKRHAKHLFSLADRRFQEHYSFLFTVFNILQRRELLLHTSLKVKKDKFDSVAKSFASVSQEAVHVVSERVARGDWTTVHSPEQQRVLNLMKEVNVITSHVPGSAAARVTMRNEIRALMMEKGLPSFYITINPADVYNPLIKFLAGAEIDIDNLLPEQVPDYWEQSLLVAKNPIIAANFFDTYMRAFISTLLAYDATKCNLEGGILGLVNAYYGCVEAQGRGSLHCHMLVWVEGSLNPNEIKDRVMKDHDVEFREKLLAFLDDTISNSVPDLVDDNGNDTVNQHPCAIRGVNLTPASDNESEGSHRQLKRTRQRELHHLVRQCQSHVHSQTCYKYWKGPLSGEPRLCRFDLDEKNTCPTSFFDSDTGELNLRCLDGMVNNFNQTIIEAIRCNMDIKFIGSGASAKAVLYYITDYITKSQLKAHVAFAALELAVTKLGEFRETEDKVTVHAKKLLQKCAYAMISHQELSGQQVAAYLMEHGDHYTSHSFKNLYWTAFEKFINDEDPSPECYRTHGSSDDSDRNNNGDLEDINANNEDSNPEDTTTEPSINIDHLSDDSNNPPAHALEAEQEEILISVNRGELIAKTNQVIDYQQRSSYLDQVCLWDMIAQVEKIRKKKTPQSNDEVEDNESYMAGNDESSENMESTSDDLLASKSNTSQKLDFMPDHPEMMTHCLRIHKTDDRLVPVPIGPSIPRRDRNEVRERYCRLMLIMFKPWRHAKHLRRSSEMWSTAFESFLENCSPRKQKIMNNMQILHECRDSRDDHFTERRNRNRNRANQLPGENTRQCQLADDDFSTEGDSEELILEHLMSISNSCSTLTSKSQQDVTTCLTYANDAGLFSSSESKEVNDYSDEDTEHVSQEQLPIEQIWKAEYEERRLNCRKKACEPLSHMTNTSTNKAYTHPIIRNASAFTTYDTHAQQHALPLDSRIQQHIEACDPETDVDIKQFIDEFTLNKEQARAFTIVAEHSMMNKPPALRMYLGGAGGTGKSRVITALKEFFNRRNQSRRFRLSSYTGVAAKNISGMTLHTALYLNQRKTKGISGNTRRDLIAMWEGVHYLFIDEVSMIGCRLLLKISQALNDAKQNESPFGGINIIFAGDFTQLPPVGETKLFSHINTHNITTKQGQDNVFGKLLWLSVKTVVILTEIMRQHGSENKRFIELLNRLRQGTCTHTDFDLLNSRLLKKTHIFDATEDWRNVPIIVSNNECKDALNVKATVQFAARTGKAMHWYYATDSRAGKEIEDDKLHRYLEGMHSGKTNQRLKKIPLVIGMPVMICQNLDVENGVVNGCSGILKKIRYHTDRNGNRHALSCVIQSATTSGPPLTSLEQQCVAVLPDATDMKFVHPYSHKVCTIKRTQLPVMPAFAMTAHKAQGQTMRRAIVDLECCRGTEAPYVMLSRIKTLDGLLILRPFTITRIQCRQSEDARREFRRLELLRLRTIAKLGDAEESHIAEITLGKTKFAHQILEGNDDEERDEQHSSNSPRRLQQLQQTNHYQTSGPCPTMSLPQTQLSTLPNVDRSETELNDVVADNRLVRASQST
jgi:hypothetical protein